MQEDLGDFPEDRRVELSSEKARAGTPGNSPRPSGEGEGTLLEA